MKLYIPEIGDVITLSEDWSFTLYSESRNLELWLITTGESREKYYEIENEHWKQWRLSNPNTRWAQCARNVPYMFPKGTQLKIDRIYIRKGAEEFSSLSFFTTINNKKVRFWAKLTDVNKIEFDPNNIQLKEKTVKINLPTNWEHITKYHKYYPFEDTDVYKTLITSTERGSDINKTNDLTITFTFEKVTFKIEYTYRKYYGSMIKYRDFLFTITDQNGVVIGK